MPTRPKILICSEHIPLRFARSLTDSYMLIGQLVWAQKEVQDLLGDISDIIVRNLIPYISPKSP